MRQCQHIGGAHGFMSRAVQRLIELGRQYLELFGSFGHCPNEFSGKYPGFARYSFVPHILHKIAQPLFYLHSRMSRQELALGISPEN
jgi:hypothetical protein